MIHTVDETTEASTPGQIKISKSKYLDYLRINGLNRLRYLILFSLPQSILFKLYRSNKIVYGFIQRTEQFKYGCLNPTIIINKEKGLIATFTNLTSYGDDIIPVVKISREPLGLIKNIEVKNGQKLPSVALYIPNQQDETATAWADFDPKIANCFTDDLVACNKLLARMTDDGWQCLATGLSQINNIEQTGLYHVNIDENMVRDAY